MCIYIYVYIHVRLFKQCINNDIHNNDIYKNIIVPPACKIIPRPGIRPVTVGYSANNNLIWDSASALPTKYTHIHDTSDTFYNSRLPWSLVRGIRRSVPSVHTTAGVVLPSAQHRALGRDVHKPLFIIALIRGGCVSFRHGGATAIAHFLTPNRTTSRRSRRQFLIRHLPRHRSSHSYQRIR